MEKNLAALSTPILNVLLAKLKTTESVTITQTILASWGLSGISEILMEILGELPSSTWKVVISSILAERKDVLHPELVWTGPTRSKKLRSTPVVLRNLIDAARTHILLTIFSYTGGEPFFEHLKQAIRRGVKVDLYLNLDQRNNLTNVSQTMIDHQLNTFLKNWGEGPHPNLFYDSRFLTTVDYYSLHAKALVVDESMCFIGSANFTERGAERNIEAGVVMHSLSLSESILVEFRNPTFVRFDAGG